MKYVILLRGVNVGGHRRVSKIAFKAVLEKLGFTDVLVYINSGNAIFTSEAVPNASKVQTALKKHFGFEVPAIILSGKKVQAIAKAIPAEWTNNAPRPDKSGQKSDVLYLFNEINEPSILEKLGYNPKIETMHYIDGAVLANISRQNQSRGSLQKAIGTKLYSNMTVRNINTARKLAELVE